MARNFRAWKIFLVKVCAARQCGRRLIQRRALLMWQGHRQRRLLLGQAAEEVCRRRTLAAMEYAWGAWRWMFARRQRYRAIHAVLARRHNLRRVHASFRCLEQAAIHGHILRAQAAMAHHHCRRNLAVKYFRAWKAHRRGCEQQRAMEAAGLLWRRRRRMAVGVRCLRECALRAKIEAIAATTANAYNRRYSLRSVIFVWRHAVLRAAQHRQRAALLAVELGNGHRMGRCFRMWKLSMRYFRRRSTQRRTAEAWCVQRQKRQIIQGWQRFRVLRQEKRDALVLAAVQHNRTVCRMTLLAWHAHATVTAEIRRRTALLTSNYRRRAASKAVRSWYDWTLHWQCVADQRAAAATHQRRKLAGRCLFAWRALLRQRRQLVSAFTSLCAVRRRRTLGRCFQVFQERLRTRAVRLEHLACLELRQAHAVQRRAWHGWTSAVERGQAARAALARLCDRQRRQECHSAWHRWTDGIELQRQWHEATIHHNRQVAGRALDQWIRGASRLRSDRVLGRLAFGFRRRHLLQQGVHRLAELVAIRAGRLARLRWADEFHANVLQGAVLRHLQAHVRQTKEYHAKAVAHRTNWMRRHVQRLHHEWRDWAAARQQHRQHTKAAEQALLLGRCRRRLMTWRQAAVVHQSLRSRLAGFARSRRRRALQTYLAAWFAVVRYTVRVRRNVSKMCTALERAGRLTALIQWKRFVAARAVSTTYDLLSVTQRRRALLRRGLQSWRSHFRREQQSRAAALRIAKRCGRRLTRAALTCWHQAARQAVLARRAAASARLQTLRGLYMHWYEAARRSAGVRRMTQQRCLMSKQAAFVAWADSARRVRARHHAVVQVLSDSRNRIQKHQVVQVWRLWAMSHRAQTAHGARVRAMTERAQRKQHFSRWLRLFHIRRGCARLRAIHQHHLMVTVAQQWHRLARRRAVRAFVTRTARQWRRIRVQRSTMHAWRKAILTTKRDRMDNATALYHWSRRRMGAAFKHWSRGVYMAQRMRRMAAQRRDATRCSAFKRWHRLVRIQARVRVLWQRRRVRYLRRICGAWNTVARVERVTLHNVDALRQELRLASPAVRKGFCLAAWRLVNKAPEHAVACRRARMAWCWTAFGQGIAKVCIAAASHHHSCLMHIPPRLPCRCVLTGSPCQD